MKLTKRFVVVLTLLVALVMGFDCFEQVTREVALFQYDVKRDQRLLGEVLKAAVVTASPEDRESQARRLSRSIETKGHIAIRWIQAAEAISSKATFEGIDTSDLLELIFGEDFTERRFRTVVPVALDHERLGAFELTESLAESAGYLRRTVMKTLFTASVLTLTSAAMVLGLGLAYIGKPTAQLIAKARRIGNGDFTGELSFRRDDELSELARELNAAGESLRVAQERVASETKARLSAIEELRHAERLATVGQLASGVAHELGTPLNVISGRASLIVDDSNVPPKAADNARVVVEQADRLSRIVGQLLDFARRRPADRSRQDLTLIAGRTVGVLQALASERRVSLTLVDEGPVPVDADAGQIEQVLTNLIVNGIQACTDGGSVEVKVNGAHSVRRGGEAPILCASLSVADTGAGIRPEHRIRLFEPFFTTKPVGEGTGLGLGVAHGIVTEHGGWITVDSRIGEGSTFTVFLPA